MHGKEFKTGLDAINDSELQEAYKKSYYESAGPPQFRHSVNHDRYHVAGLRGVRRLFKNALTRQDVERQAEKIVSWLISQKCGQEELMHAAIACDFAGYARLIQSVADIIQDRKPQYDSRAE
jgi:hypothetical protein